MVAFTVVRHENTGAAWHGGNVPNTLDSRSVSKDGAARLVGAVIA